MASKPEDVREMAAKVQQGASMNEGDRAASMLNDYADLLKAVGQDTSIPEVEAQAKRTLDACAYKPACAVCQRSAAMLLSYAVRLKQDLAKGACACGGRVPPEGSHGKYVCCYTRNARLCDEAIS